MCRGYPQGRSPASSSRGFPPLRSFAWVGDGGPRVDPPFVSCLSSGYYGKRPEVGVPSSGEFLIIFSVVDLLGSDFCI